MASWLRAVGMVLLGSSALAGCSNPCVEQCTATQACENADPSIDCESTCADQKTTAEDSGCTSEYDTLVDCQGGVDDVCAVNEATCKGESDAYVVCLVDYCINFPGADACQN